MEADGIVFVDEGVPIAALALVGDMAPLRKQDGYLRACEAKTTPKSDQVSSVLSPKSDKQNLLRNPPPIFLDA